MTEPLTTTAGLARGDVVQYSIRLRPRGGGDSYWMTRFAAVVNIPSTGTLQVLTLVMHPDPKYEPRHLRLRDSDTVVIKLDEDRWPQGVIAARMKHLSTGLLKL